MVAPFSALSIGQVDLFENYSHLIGPCPKKKQTKNLKKNAINKWHAVKINPIKG